MPLRAAIGPLVLAGALVALYQLCFFAALDRAGVAIGTVVTIGSGPVFAGVLGVVAGQGFPGVRWLGSTALAVAGVIVLVGPTTGGSSLAGVGLALLSGIGYAGYTVVAKGLIGGGAPGDAVMARAFAIGGLLLAPALLVGDPTALVSVPGLVTALYLGIVPTALAYLLFARGLASLSAATVTTVVLLEPVVASLLGILVLGEELQPAAVVGCAMVLAAVAALAVRPRVRAHA